MTEKNKSKLHITKRLMTAYVPPHVNTLILAIFCMVIAAVTTAAFAKLLQPIFDDVLIEQKSGFLLPVALAVLACFILRGLSTYGYVVLMNNIAQDIIAKIQTELFEKIIRADAAFFHNNPSGTLITRLISDVQMMRFAIIEGVVGIAKAALTLLLLLALMFYQNWQLSLATVVLFPLAGVLVAYLGRKIRKISKDTQEGVSTLSDKLSQTLQGVFQVKVNNKESFETKRMDNVIVKVRKLYKKSVRIGNLTTPINDVVVGIILFGLVFYGGSIVLSGYLSPGSLVTFIAAFLLAYEPLKKISKLYTNYNVGLGAADRVFAIMDMQNEVKDKSRAKNVKFSKPKITFENVSFAYENSDDVAIKDLSFEVNSGETVALVGPSGAGKSTIFNLVPRFFDPNSGRILVDGIDIKDLKVKALRDHIAMVPQDPIIFDESVAYNISYGRPKSADAKSIESAARAAYADEFINELSQGFDTKLGERGTKLSGGQRQRVAIARAILKDTPILLLDEATSALDNESETFIQKSLYQLCKNRTSIIIAHRLSTIKDADKIIVIDKGELVEQGTHETLLKKKGLYAKLYKTSIAK